MTQKLKQLMGILLCLALGMSVTALGMSVTALADHPERDLLLSLSGAQYGSCKVSVGGEETSLSVNDSTRIRVKTGDAITITFYPAEDGRIKKFYLDNSSAPLEEHLDHNIVNNSCSFTLKDKTTGIVVQFAYKNPVETVTYVDELGAEHSTLATVLTGAEPVDITIRAVLCSPGGQFRQIHLVRG